MKNFADPKSEEFAALVAAAGWSQADVARRLQITPAAVSQLCSGKTRPRAATLNLLRLMIEREKPAALKMPVRDRAATLAPWEKELLDELRRLRPAAREVLLPLLRQFIRTMGGIERRRG